MRESLYLASIYKKFQSLEQKQILNYELKLENNGERLLTNFVVTQSGENCKWPGVPVPFPHSKRIFFVQ